MSKKHGFRGTPVRPAGVSGMGRVFEQRGDKMVTQREGIKDFHRNPETENPDMDRYFAKLARDLLRPEQVDRTNALAKVAGAKSNYDPQRKAAQIMLETRAKVRKAEQGAQVSQGKDKRKDDGVLPDNIPATVPPTSKAPSREKQTPVEMPKKPGFYDFSGKNPPKEIRKNGRVYRRK